MKTRPTTPKVAKSQLRVPFSEEEYRILEERYLSMSADYRKDMSINQYLADIFTSEIRPLQKQMDDTNQITLTINHSVQNKYSIHLYAYIYTMDMQSLEALARYIGYNRVNLFRYLVLKRLYE